MPTTQIRRLYEIRNRFGAAEATEKLELLRMLGDAVTRSPKDLSRLHTALCFIRAFPDSPGHYKLAGEMLADFAFRVRLLRKNDAAEVWDTGIAGTPIHYAFSYEVATWLARHSPDTVSIDWEDIEDTDRLDELLSHLLHDTEDEFFDSGHVSTEDWIRTAAENYSGTDFDWLMAQRGPWIAPKTWAHFYNSAELALAWNLGDSHFSKSRNQYRPKAVRPRSSGMRRPPRRAAQEITRPLRTIERLPRRNGARMIDVAMASLAVRHRETYHFSHANPREVYLADVGEGIAVAVFGLLPEDRFPLECTMGFLVLSNGMPIGYGGSSILFRQVNTGVNLFDEYRGSEAAYLWTQVMRVYHQLTGCTRYIANAYQFGADNDEALESGAFWFYYRLGYRPVLREIRSLAATEAKRIRGDRAYRSNIRTLRRLSSCDMHLTLPGAKASELFDEKWLVTSSMLATRHLAEAGTKTRREAVKGIASQLARDLNMRNLARWSSAERTAMERVAPMIAIAGPANWSPESKHKMRELLRAKGGAHEARYARLLSRHNTFLQALRKVCRRAS